MKEVATKMLATARIAVAANFRPDVPPNSPYTFLIEISVAKGGSHLYAGKISTMNIYA